MLHWFKKRRLQKLHRKLLAEARDLQRRGDIQGFAAKTAEAEQVGADLARLDRGDTGADSSSSD